MLAAKDTSRVLTKLSSRFALLRTKAAPKSTVSFDHASSSTDNNYPEESFKQATYSDSLSWSSPESDFCSSHLGLKSTYTDFDVEHKVEENQSEVTDNSWSGMFSFASPESDFTSGSTHLTSNIQQEAVQTEDEIDVATKEAKDSYFQVLKKSSPERNDVAYSLSFASAESDFCNPEFTNMLNERQKKQLENTSLLATLPDQHNEANQFSSSAAAAVESSSIEEQLSSNSEYEELRAHAELLSHEDPLPITFDEAKIEDDDRAIVITEAEVPFRIVSVNSAWEGLCGYTNDECQGKTLHCIQGDDTNQAAVTALMSQLLRGEEAGTLLTNYRKDGSKFLNRLRVAPLRDEHNAVTHFVGVLKEVQEAADHFDEGSKILA